MGRRHVRQVLGAEEHVVRAERDVDDVQELVLPEDRELHAGGGEAEHGFLRTDSSG